METVNLPKIMEWIRTYLRKNIVQSKSAEEIADDLGVSVSVATKLAQVRDGAYVLYKMHSQISSFSREKINPTVQGHFMNIFDKGTFNKIKGEIKMDSTVKENIQGCTIGERAENRAKAKVSL